MLTMTMTGRVEVQQLSWEELQLWPCWVVQPVSVALLVQQRRRGEGNKPNKTPHRTLDSDGAFERW